MKNIVSRIATLLTIAIIGTSVMIAPLEDAPASTWHECAEVLCYVHDNMEWECYGYYWEVRHDHLYHHPWDACD